MNRVNIGFNHPVLALNKKNGSFLVMFSLLKANKFEENCGFIHIYRSSPSELFLMINDLIIYFSLANNK